MGGSILGYTGASVISEHKELREYIDEHYEKEPELYVQSPREEALARRRSSLNTRKLPEVPGPGGRALPSAKYRSGPNGYRRPSLVRASSFDGRSGVGSRSYSTAAYRTGPGDGPGRVGSGYSGRGLRNSEGSGRRLPSRPSFSRTAYSLEQGGWHTRAGSPGVRRPPLLRHNSNLHRKMSYRQSNNNMESYLARQQSSGQWRRYGREEGGGGYQEPARGEGWSLQEFQRQASIEDSNYQISASRERRRFVVRQRSVSQSEM